MQECRKAGLIDVTCHRKNRGGAVALSGGGKKKNGRRGSSGFIRSEGRAGPRGGAAPGASGAHRGEVLLVACRDLTPTWRVAGERGRCRCAGP
jgi:hypothetical protein